MGRMVLQSHNWRESKPDDNHELKVLFLFTLTSEAEQQSGVKPDARRTFWTEVRLSRDLATRGRWAVLSKAERIKAMFRYAQEQIRDAGRKVREVPLFWTPASRLGDGPPWDLTTIEFPKAPPYIFEKTQDSDPSLEARKAAGLS